MLGLRARAALLPCPSAAVTPTPSLSGFARRLPLLASAALSPLPPARPPSFFCARRDTPMRPASGGLSRPTTRGEDSDSSSYSFPSSVLTTSRARQLAYAAVSLGADLSDLAVEYSLCPSKENGGMLGWVRRGQMVPEFEEAAFGAPLNKVVRCKTKFGWHLLQVLAERDQCVLEDIAPEELHAKMQDPSFLEEAQLIDVREPDEVQSFILNF
ncbi:hypothetical protein E2562_018407 [Oryza meyeriana var. granulata]|uniref:Peptidyl-prolyl cis-trans isomerase n=1 Tax=Oryza meyeriana var. granulata TaxID=110450 RepID=A0A6G1D5L6_9ORYZ|nr:hypothetical protein E2562_018407 [Oryza meyeriana var. granulata]